VFTIEITRMPQADANLRHSIGNTTIIARHFGSARRANDAPSKIYPQQSRNANATS
jgi:hypothetical protein